MKKNTTPTLPPSTTPPSVSDWLPFAAFLFTYLTGDPLPLVEDFELLAPSLLASPAFTCLGALPLDPLWTPQRSATLLCHICQLFLTTSDQRSRQHRQVAGGKTHPQRFHLRDLRQKAPASAPLRLSLGALCRLLAKECPLLIRLLRAARRAYRRDPDDLLWKAAHEAAVRVALRILKICSALYEQTKSGWMVEVCLRWVFRQTWAACFGPTVTLTAAAQPWLEPLDLPLWREREVLALLTSEGITPKGRKAAAPPGPFAQVVAAWQAEGVPEALTGRVLPKEVSHRVRFQV